MCMMQETEQRKMPPNNSIIEVINETRWQTERRIGEGLNSNGDQFFLFLYLFFT